MGISRLPPHLVAVSLNLCERCLGLCKLSARLVDRRLKCLDLRRQLSRLPRGDARDVPLEILVHLLQLLELLLGQPHPFLPDRKLGLPFGDLGTQRGCSLGALLRLAGHLVQIAALLCQFGIELLCLCKQRALWGRRWRAVSSAALAANAVA